MPTKQFRKVMDKDTFFSSFSITSREKNILFSRPVLMGILNATPDSFFDGGKYQTEAAILARAKKILDDGGDIIDIGVTSTRPGTQLPQPEEEAEKLAQVVGLVRAHYPNAIISADTCFSLSAHKAIDSGADIINDIGGGYTDAKMFESVAEMQVPYILSHYRNYEGNTLLEMSQYFSEKLEELYKLGVKDVWIDPGFGFKKSLQQNFEIFGCMQELCQLFREPMLVGISRKSMIYKTIGGVPDQPETLIGTTALNTEALLKGARILRVHDVKEADIVRKLIFDN